MSEPKQAAGVFSPTRVLVILTTVTCFALYAWSYFAMCEAEVTRGGGRNYRIYGARWQTYLFLPAATLESFVTWSDIRLIVRGDYY